MRVEAKVYLSHTDAEILRLAAVDAGMSLSAFLRQAGIVEAAKVARTVAAMSKQAGQVREDGVLIGQARLPHLLHDMFLDSMEATGEELQ